MACIVAWFLKTHFKLPKEKILKYKHVLFLPANQISFN